MRIRTLGRLAVRFGVTVAVAAAVLAAPVTTATDHTSSQAATFAAVAVAGLETEERTDPLGIDAAHPRFSWRLESQRRGVRQSAYRVRVASSQRLADSGKADVWDSGRVTTDRPFADYAGPALAARTRYYWAVDVWDERGSLASAAASAWFETAFTDPGQWTASWISGPPAPTGCSDQRQCSPAPLLRDRFTVSGQVASARLYASGLGYGTYFLNGTRVGDAVLSPGFTDYTERAFYVTADVTGLVQQGDNAIGAMLGRGPFGSVGFNFAGYASAPWHADPQLRLELHVRYRDGGELVVRSGPGWTTTDGPTRFDDYMLGETYDARRAAQLNGWSTPGFDDSAWVPASGAPGPKGVLEAEVGDPVRPQQSIPFQAVTRTESGSYLFDLGQNVAGNAVLDADLPAGQVITLHYGEKLDANGHVDTSGGSFDGSVMQLDTYTAGPGPDVWRPEFTYQGFQYVEVTGLDSPPDVSMLTAQVWHADLPAIGDWTSSNDLANRIYAASRGAILSNSMSIPTDTPVYEKTGYTADGQVVAGAASYMFDTRRFYEKWLTDIRQSVAPNGDMGISAPLPTDPPDLPSPTGFLYTSPGWDAALFVIPDILKSFDGDTRPAAQALPEMKRLRGYYDTQTVNDIIPGSCTVALAPECSNGLGDWAAVAGMSYGAALDSTAWYDWMLGKLAEFADDAGQTATADSARARASTVDRAFQSTFFDPLLHVYRDPLNTQPGDPARPGTPSAYSQHQNALPLGLGLVPADRLAPVGTALAADVRARGNHLSTGIIGTRFLFDALTRTGHVDQAWAALTQTTYPSYGYWLDSLGYTSLGEYWEAGQRSHNHQMFGSVVQWLYAGLAGIRPSQPGFAEIQIRPELPTGLDHVAAHTDTVRGRVAVDWTRTSTGLTLQVQIPANAQAVVEIPAASAALVSETGTGQTLPASAAPGVSLIGQKGDRVVYRVGSGSYRFVSAQPS
jgi:alpha-L-rhamnosidase